jgi:hypothetical protein
MLTNVGIITLIILICIFLFILVKRQQDENDMIKVLSPDGYIYHVRQVDRDCPYTMNQAVDILSSLRLKSQEFIERLNVRYNNHNSQDKNKETFEDIGTENRLVIERLTKNFNPNSLWESSSFHKGTSYSLNKGEKIVLCLRQKEDNSFVPMNTMLYVLLHELTHLGTVEDYPHSPVFDKNFRFVLKEAVDQKLYQYEPYHEQPVVYCGKLISDTPLRQGSIRWPTSN